MRENELVMIDAPNWRELVGRIRVTVNKAAHPDREGRRWFAHISPDPEWGREALANRDVEGVPQPPVTRRRTFSTSARPNLWYDVGYYETEQEAHQEAMRVVGEIIGWRLALHYTERETVTRYVAPKTLSL